MKGPAASAPPPAAGTARLASEPAATFTLQPRASDTGGNFTSTSLQTIALVKDATPPHLRRVTPAAGALLGNLTVLSATFNKPIDPSTLTSSTFRLFAAG